MPTLAVSLPSTPRSSLAVKTSPIKKLVGATKAASMASPRSSTPSSPRTPPASKDATTTVSPRTISAPKTKPSSSVLTSPPPAKLSKSPKGVLKTCNSEANSLMSEFTSKSPRSRSPAQFSDDTSSRTKSPRHSRPATPLAVDGDLAAKNEALLQELSEAQKELHAAKEAYDALALRTEEVHAEAQKAQAEAERAQAQAMRRQSTLGEAMAEAAKLRVALEAAEDARAAEAEERARLQAECEALRDALRAAEELELERSKLRSGLEGAEEQKQLMTIKLAQSQEVASTAAEEAARLNQMFASFNRHAVGVGKGVSRPYGGSMGVRGYGRLATGPYLVTNLVRAPLEQRAAHYKAQGSASYRSASPRFGKSVELAARGVKAGTNVALSEEHPMMPCPGSHHSNRDHKGKFWATGCATNAIFDLPQAPPPLVQAFAPPPPEPLRRKMSF